MYRVVRKNPIRGNRITFFIRNKLHGLIVEFTGKSCNVNEAEAGHFQEKKTLATQLNDVLQLNAQLHPESI